MIQNYIFYNIYPTIQMSKFNWKLFLSIPIQVNDSSMALLGETQEEDRRLIAEMVLQKMHVYCKATTMRYSNPFFHPPLSKLKILWNNNAEEL